MRNLLVALFLLVAVRAWADAPADFQAANAAYADGRFAEARDDYEKIVASGQYSANLFYNLGNAWYRLENPGQAALAYERALALQPGHAEARANLQWVQQATGARLPATPGWMEYYPTLSANAYLRIVTVAAWVLAFALVARAFRLTSARLGYGVAGAAIVVGLLAVPMLREQLAGEKTAVVVSAETTARYAPTTSGGAAEKLPAGSVVRLLALRGDWTYAESPTAEKLWIPSADLAPVRL